MAIDLTRLKAVELPTKEVEVEVLGEKQKVKISAISDSGYLDFVSIREAAPERAESKIRLWILENCAGMSAADAALLMERDGKCAAAIVAEVFALTDEFTKAQAEARESAKKKQTEPSPTADKQ